MKKLSLALAAIGLSSSIFAALPVTTDPTVVNIPALDGGFVIGLMGDYLEPSPTNGDLDYASFNNGPTSSFYSHLNDVDPGYNWGWGANIGYVFPQTGNDINLAYSYLSASNTNHSVTQFPNNFSLIGIPSFNFSYGGLFESVSDFFNIAAATAKAEYTLNQIDLTVGQFINVGCRLRLHPNAGLRWASLDRDLYTSYAAQYITNHGDSTAATTNIDVFSLAAHDSSDFSGIGPVAGLDASYYLGMGFGAVMHVDGALLIGTLQNKLNVAYAETAVSGEGFFTGTDLNQIFNFSAPKDNHVVPVTDEKLGLDYTYLFNNAANSNLTLEIGWQASQYFNAVDRLHGNINLGRITSFVDTDATSSVVSRNTSDVGFEGPYATLILHV
jgi:hypothetical protein